MFQEHRWERKIINSTHCGALAWRLFHRFFITFISEESKVIPSYSFHECLLRQFIKITLKHADRMFFRNVKVSNEDFPAFLHDGNTVDWVIDGFETTKA